ncbi:hypothetical protein CKA32_007018 [Geitlerinema sp. FC II]|nr:hypothetical protein CKA32_007018 [Geitlerinema sp. FC II]
MMGTLPLSLAPLLPLSPAPPTPHHCCGKIFDKLELLVGLPGLFN